MANFRYRCKFRIDFFNICITGFRYIVSRTRKVVSTYRKVDIDIDIVSKFSPYRHIEVSIYIYYLVERVWLTKCCWSSLFTAQLISHDTFYFCCCIIGPYRSSYFKAATYGRCRANCHPARADVCTRGMLRHAIVSEARSYWLSSRNVVRVLLTRTYTSFRARKLFRFWDQGTRVDPTHPLTLPLTRTKNGPETRLHRLGFFLECSELRTTIFLPTLIVTYNFLEIYNLPLEDQSWVLVRSTG